jgi:hypothetical protein
MKMNRKMRLISMVAVFIGSVGIATGQSFAVGLFEDEEAPAGAQAGVATPTAEGKALATQIIQKLNESYYKMYQVVGGLDATYTVKKWDRDVGKATVSANLPSGSPRWSVKFEGNVSDGAVIENRLDAAWTPLLSDLSRRVITAEKCEEGFRVPYSSSAKEAYLIVSKDYRLLKEVIKSEDGSETEWLYHDQEVGGKRYLDTVELRTGPGRTKVTYTYARREGVALISRLEIQEMTAWGDTTLRYFANLDKVTFKKAAATAEAAEATGKVTGEGAEAAAGPAIDATSWDDLSREVIPKVLEMSLDRTTILQYVRSASCTIDVVISTKMTASTTNPYFTPPAIPPSAVSFSYSFEDSDNDGTLTEDEITIETTHMSDANLRFAAGRISEGLRALATFNIINILPRVTVKTHKTQQGYEVTLTPKEDELDSTLERAGLGKQHPIRLTVSNDFRVTGMRTRSIEGLDQVTTFKHVRLGGKWLLTELETSSGGATAFGAGDKSVISYRMEGGLPLVTKSVVDSSTPSSVGTLQIHQEYTFSNWKIARRDKPLQVATVRVGEEETGAAAAKVEAPEVKIPRTEEANKLAIEVLKDVGEKYYSLWETDVASFDATFALQLEGKPAGTLKATWNRHDRVPTCTLEGASEQNKKLAQAFLLSLLYPVVGGYIGVAPTSGVYAVKSGNEYIMDFTEQAPKGLPECQAALAFVAADLSQFRSLVLPKQGGALNMVFNLEPAEGKLLVGTGTMTMSQAKGTTAKHDLTWTYTRREGTVFVKRVNIDQTIGKNTVQWIASLQDVTFQRGARPAGEELRQAEDEYQKSLEGLTDTLGDFIQKHKDEILRGKEIPEE